MTYMFILKCALKLVEEIILYYDVRSKKHHINTYVSLMYGLKNLERYLRVHLLGPGPRLIKKEFTGPRSHKV